MMNKPKIRSLVSLVGFCGSVRNGDTTGIPSHDQKTVPHPCIPHSDPAEFVQECDSVSSRKSGSPQVKVHLLHLVVAGLLLALMGIFMYLRRPTLLCLACVAAFLGPFGSTAPAYGLAGGLTLVLPAASEWLLDRSAGSRLVWPPVLALLTGVFGVCCALFHVQGALSEPEILVCGMLLSLPWVPATSAVILGMSGPPKGRDSMARNTVTRTLLSAFQRRVMERSVSSPNVDRTAGKTTAILLAHLDELDAQVERLTASEHSRLRHAVLSAQAMLEAELIEDALGALVEGFSIGDAKGVDPGGPDGAFETLTGQRGWFIRNSVAMIHAYHRIVPEHRRRGCRFEPTCSAYSEEALMRHGLFYGMCLCLKRALRCVPYGDAGFDPVPETHGTFGSSRIASAEDCSETSSHKSNELYKQ